MQWIIIILLCILLFFYLKYSKAIRCGNMICITGGIKTGKTALSVRQAKQLHNRAILQWWLKKYIIRYILFPFYGFKTNWKLLEIPPKPLLYSNIPLKWKHVPVTKELLQRKEKPVPKSICYLCEASLIADSMTYKDPILNEQLLLFNKLWGHASKGGYLIYDTQSVGDNHYAVKRCLNSYIYIHHTIKIPFFMVMFIREERYNEDNQTSNIYGEDIENTLKIHLVPKSIWKKYDCYCYSILTDNKPCKTTNDEIKATNLKANNIVSFKEYKTLKEPEKPKIKTKENKQ